MKTNRNFMARKLAVKAIAVLLAALFIVPMVAALPNASASEETHDATMSSHEVWVNGWKTDIRGYIIYGMNFVLLRDIGKAFDIHIDYEAATKTIVIDTREPYTGAASAVGNLTQTAVATKVTRNLRLNGSDRVGMHVHPGGVQREIGAYVINGNSYLALNSAAGMLDVGLSFDAATRRANFDTTVGFGFGNGNMKTLGIPLPRVRQRDGSVAVPTVPSAPSTPSAPSVPTTPSVPSAQPDRQMTKAEAEAYVLSVEYQEAVRSEFYRLLNEYRVANGLRELSVNLELQAYADLRAREQKTRFGHTRPNGTAAGSGWYNSGNMINTRYAENVGGFGSMDRFASPTDAASGILQGWQRSPGHNAHLLYDFDSRITMAFGFAPERNGNIVGSGKIFATGY